MDTRTCLIRTAEQLYAVRGIDAVSLREINREAGQRNASALHYHFGSRDALIEAIVAARMSPINARRLALLCAAERSGRPITLRFLAEAMILPLAEAADRAGSGNLWIRFLAQVYNSGTIDLAAIVRRGNHDESWRRLAGHARSVLGSVPREIVDQRLVISIRQAVHALADWQRGVLEQQSRARIGSLDLLVNNLVDMTVGALGAPVSSDTARHLPEAGRKGLEPAKAGETGLRMHAG